MALSTRTRSGGDPPRVVLRVAIALLGGYGVVYALAGAGALALVRSTSTSRPDAVLISTCLALFAGPAVVVAAFATRRPFALAGVATLVTAAGLALARMR